MSDDFMKGLIELDNAAEKAGGYVMPLENKEVVDYRKLLAYCKEHNKDPLDLTLREYNSFVIVYA